MGQGRQRRRRTDQLGVHFTDRLVNVVGVHHGPTTSEVIWATTAPLTLGAVIDGVVRDVPAAAASLAAAGLPDAPVVVVVPEDRRLPSTSDDRQTAVASAGGGIVDAVVSRRLLTRVRAVLDGAQLRAVGWIPEQFARAVVQAAPTDDPESLLSAGADLTLALGGALWTTPEPWPRTRRASTRSAGWRVAKVN